MLDLFFVRFWSLNGGGKNHQVEGEEVKKKKGEQKKRGQKSGYFLFRSTPCRTLRGLRKAT